MKCILLAGGMGDRLWPLSRKDFPKQFLNMKKGRSLFQETVLRGMPFCDAFLVVTAAEYAPIVEGQLLPLSGLSVQVLTEETPSGTAAAVEMALRRVDPQETVLVMPSDLLIQSDSFAEAVHQARMFAEQGKICLFGVRPERSASSFGYICCEDRRVQSYIEKPDEATAAALFARPGVYVNSGIVAGRADVLTKRLSDWDKEQRPAGFEAAVLEGCGQLEMVTLEGLWEDISDYAAYEQMTRTQAEMDTVAYRTVQKDCVDTSVINTTQDRLVIANGLEHVLVVSSPDAIYVTKKGQANEIRRILREQHDAFAPFFDESPVKYRPWGIREVIRKEPGFRVRRVTIYPGQSLTRHAHERRNENYSVVSGTLTVEVEGRIRWLTGGEGINILPGQMHRLYNETDQPVVAIEVDTGAEIVEEDIRHESAAEAVLPAGRGVDPGAQATADAAGAASHAARDAAGEEQLPVLYRLRPAFQDYLWGGQRLRDQFGKETPYEVTAESWELSAHPNGPCIIKGGPFDGMRFDRFADAHAEISGWKGRIFGRFPILIKLIDAARPLSIQIHPGDDYAFVHEGEFGKNEMWVVLDAAPGAYVYCGLKEDTDREEILRAIEEKRITALLNRIEVHAGDVIFVPSGTIHAIGEGLLICEIQQSSNSTYRVYDYDRTDASGNRRPLHIQKALDVVDTHAYHPRTEGAGAPEVFEGSVRQLLAQCKYFECVRHEIREDDHILMDESSFKALFLLSGEAEISSGEELLTARAGECIFVRSGRRVLHVHGTCELLAVNV